MDIDDHGWTTEDEDVLNDDIWMASLDVVASSRGTSPTGRTLVLEEDDTSLPCGNSGMASPLCEGMPPLTFEELRQLLECECCFEHQDRSILSYVVDQHRPFGPPAT